MSDSFRANMAFKFSLPGLAAAVLSFLLNATPARAELSYVETLIQRARTADLADDAQWMRLMHYDHRWVGGVEGQADGRDFYLAPDGKHDSEAELEATLAGFFSTVPVDLKNPKDQHPRCRFPARFTWLSQKLAIDPLRLPPADCSRFEHFRKTIDAHSVTVVFSSYFLNSPASAFGHSFLRLNKAPLNQPGARYELLDYGIGYAAVLGQDSLLAYPFKTLAGLYPGTFTSVPYFYKVREYNDFEARDIWEYDVELTQPQIDLMVAHIWELGSTYFDYWYFTENCSYFVLTVLEAANPALTLSQRQPKIVIPSDTIRVLNEEPHFVKRVSFRPSIRALFLARLSQLSPRLRQELKKVTDAKTLGVIDPSLSPADRALVIDAASDFFDLNFAKELQNRDSEASQWKQNFLLARSEIPLPSPELKTPTPWHENPAIGHGSRRFGLSGGDFQTVGHQVDHGYLLLSQRFALQDLLDPSPGYPDNAQIEMFNFRFREDLNPGHFSLDEASLFRVTALNVLTDFTHKTSWTATLGAQRFRDRDCDYCLGPRASAGAGYTLRLGDTDENLTYAMVDSEFGYANGAIGSAWRIGAGPMAGLRLRLGSSVAWLTELGYRYLPLATYKGDWRFESTVRFAVNRWLALDFRASARNLDREGQVGVLYYY